jgi:hypothetical protein
VGWILSFVSLLTSGLEITLLAECPLDRGKIKMSENERRNDLDSFLCKEHYKKISGSLFDSVKLQKPNISSYFAEQLFELERFVDELLQDDETPFVAGLDACGKVKYTSSSLADRHFRRVPEYIKIINMLSPRYEYSEHINVFIACCHSMGLQNETLDWKDVYPDPQKTNPRLGGRTSAELFNALVIKIRSEWKLKNIQAKVNERKKEASDQKEDYCKYADSLLDNSYYQGCARLVVLRIDLFYQKHYADSMSVVEIAKDLDHLFENKRCNSLFDFMKGYIAKLEYGADKGAHWHVIFFFDGSKKKNSSHIKLTEDIGEYWIKVITKGRGDYWNSNDNTDRFDTLGRRGIGVINWYDTSLRRNLKELVIGYLCKTDQFIRPKWGHRVRLFRRGNYPKLRVNKRGRSRKKV